MSIYQPGTMTPRGKDQKQDAEDRKVVKELSERDERVADNLKRTIWGA